MCRWGHGQRPRCLICMNLPAAMKNFLVAPIWPLEGLPQGKLCRARAGHVDLVLLRRGERIYALAEKCAHLGGPLAEGEVEGLSVRCPWHGSRFSLENGRVLEGPASYNQPCLAVRV